MTKISCREVSWQQEGVNEKLQTTASQKQEQKSRNAIQWRRITKRTLNMLRNLRSLHILHLQYSLKELTVRVVQNIGFVWLYTVLYQF